MHGHAVDKDEGRGIWTNLVYGQMERDAPVVDSGVFEHLGILLLLGSNCKIFLVKIKKYMPE
jgi:hypothetical protein